MDEPTQHYKLRNIALPVIFFSGIALLVGTTMRDVNQTKQEKLVPEIHKLDSIYNLKQVHTYTEKQAYKFQRRQLWEEYRHDEGKFHF